MSESASKSPNVDNNNKDDDPVASSSLYDERPSAASCVPCSSLDLSRSLDFVTVQQRVAQSLSLWTVKQPPQQQQQQEQQQVTKMIDPSHHNRQGLPAFVLSRSFVARNYQAALDFVHAMAVIAEQENHHPDLHWTEYRKLEIVLWTHHVASVTESDLNLAQRLDTILVDYSPNWLRKHPEAVTTAKKVTKTT